MIYSEMVSNGGSFQSFGKLVPQAGRGNFFFFFFLPKLSWQPLGVGVHVMQMPYNESRGYPRAEVGEESCLFFTCGL